MVWVNGSIDTRGIVSYLSFITVCFKFVKPKT